MHTMVLTVEFNGVVEHTLKDSFFDTRFLGGERRVERVSEVLFDDKAQQFYIKWLMGPNSGETENDKDGNTSLFDTYEAAVEHEISVLNAWRSQGIRLTA